METSDNIPPTPGVPFGDTARPQPGQQRIRIDIDERTLPTLYANGFHPSASAEELILDFGMNQTRPTAEPTADRELVFQVNQRIVLNYYCAKRLAIALGHIIRRYEQEFGELELDTAKRRNPTDHQK